MQQFKSEFFLLLLLSKKHGLAKNIYSMERKTHWYF